MTCNVSNKTKYLLLSVSFAGVSKAILDGAGQAVEDECEKLGKSIYSWEFTCWHHSVSFTISKIKKRNFNIA